MIEVTREEFFDAMGNDFYPYPQGKNGTRYTVTLWKNITTNKAYGWTKRDTWKVKPNSYWVVTDEVGRGDRPTF